MEAARAESKAVGLPWWPAKWRNLASRSAQAAKEIKTLIDSTTNSVATGSRYVHLAGESMNEIRSSIGSVSGIMREISIATSEQMKGIQEINHAVTHLDRMVQQNAELVVQSAAAAGALQSQAGDLAETAGISAFNVRGGARSPGKTRARVNFQEFCHFCLIVTPFFDQSQHPHPPPLVLCHE